MRAGQRKPMPARADCGCAAVALCAVFAPAAGREDPGQVQGDARASVTREPRTNLNVVGVLKIGDPKAKNVLVLNPGHLGRAPPTSSRSPGRS